jgi:hypothetical protein
MTSMRRVAQRMVFATVLLAGCRGRVDEPERSVRQMPQEQLPQEQMPVSLPGETYEPVRNALTEFAEIVFPDKTRVPHPDTNDLSPLMTWMKQKADTAIRASKEGRDPEAAYQKTALEILRHMRPRFGPANAWLFNEREGMIFQLADELAIEPDDADALFVSHVCDAFIEQLEQVVMACDEAGLALELRPADRGELLWTPAPGYALVAVDTTSTVKYKPTYAGTVAGPDVPEVDAHPRATLYLFPPFAGSAEMGMMTREQPGEPYFYTGDLVAFVLQEPQSGDVSPDTVLEKASSALASAGIVKELSDDDLRRVVDALGGQAVCKHGIARVTSTDPAPKAMELPASCAVVWFVPNGAAAALTLLFP